MEILKSEHVIDLAVSMSDVREPDLAAFRENLDTFVDSLNNEARLATAAFPAVYKQLATPLRNRIEVSDWVRQFPEIHDEVIEKPIILTGMPRSGTTYFQYLFDPEPTMRMLRYWEGDRPCPPPGYAPETIEGRIAACAAEKAGREAASEVRAKIAQIHLMDADGPQECHELIAQTFANVGHYWPFSVPGNFEDCLDSARLLEAYKYHKQVLQLLQWRGQRKRWVLKWACHLVALDEILAVHPEARFVVTYRDPVQVLASNCSMSLILRNGSSSSPDPAEVGRQMKDMLLTYARRLIAFDERHSDRIAHVSFQTAVDQPEVAMAQALGALGMDMSPAFAEAIVAWRRDNPPGKRGRHDYTLEDYGLDAGEVAEEFSFYTDRYDIPSEYEAQS